MGREGLGSIVVFASGNSNQNFSGVTFPANVDRAIAVGAVNRNGNVWNYSSRGNALDVVVPSGNVNLNGDVATTDRIGANGYEAGNYTSRFGGTSAACPQVSGIAALILSFNPNLTQAQVRQAIESTCRKLSGYSYSNNSAHPNGTWNSEVGHGLVNAYAAVQAACPTLVNFINRTVTTDTTVKSCGDINVENVTVKNGAKFALDAAGAVNIGNNFEVEENAEFEIIDN